MMRATKLDKLVDEGIHEGRSVMVHYVKDLSRDQRAVVESILGTTLGEDETLTIRHTRILREAPTGDSRSNAFNRYRRNLDMLANRVADVPEDEIDGAIDEALRVIRHHAE